MKYLIILLLCVFVNANTGLKSQEELAKALVSAIKKNSKEEYGKLFLSLTDLKDYLKEVKYSYSRRKLLKSATEEQYKRVLEQRSYSHLMSQLSKQNIDVSKISYQSVDFKKVEGYYGRDYYRGYYESDKPYSRKDYNDKKTEENNSKEDDDSTKEYEFKTIISLNDKEYLLKGIFVKRKNGWFLHKRVNLADENEEKKYNKGKEYKVSDSMNKGVIYDEDERPVPVYEEVKPIEENPQAKGKEDNIIKDDSNVIDEVSEEVKPLPAKNVKSPKSPKKKPSKKKRKPRTKAK